MGVGGAMQSGVTATINNMGSTIVITPYAQATTDGGYSGQTETDSTAVNETAVPFDEVKGIIKQKFGDLETGQFQLALKYTVTFDLSGDTKYKATWQDDTYDIIRSSRYSIEDTLIAWIITLTKRHD